MDNTQLSYLTRLHEASQQGRLVVFVGAGVSANSGVPNWGELIDALKDDLSHSLSKEKDDLKTAQIYKDSCGHKDYLEKIKSVLKDGKVACNPIHHAILQLNPVHIITTNYDDLIEQAIQIDYKQYDVVSQDSDLPYYRYPNKLVKMHGDFKTGNIVLAEEDYYNYTSNFPLIRSFVTSLFTTNLVLFVGFSFDDLNLKIILNNLKNILDKDMQRVYLLMSDSSIDKESNRYYEQKGINIVNIPDIETYIDIFNISIDQHEIDKLSDERGRTMYKQIQAIKQFEKNASDNIVSRLYHSLESIQHEMSMLGDGIKYVFPANERPYWNYYSHGLRSGSETFDNISKELKTYNGRKVFVQRHPKKERDFLKEQALLQGILKIDELQILTEYDCRHCEEKLSKYKTVDDFYDLDFNAVIKQINLLSQTGLFYDRRDLILPYLLCRIGRFYDAYLIYKSRIAEFWNKELYVLYFIGLYNLYQIRYQIQNEMLFRQDIDTESIVEEIGAFDLETILNRIPIAPAVKLTLRDIFYNRFFSEKAKESVALAQKLHKQKKQSELGGTSQNGNIPALTSKFWGVFEFCIRNCIEYNNSYFGVLTIDTIIGILNSHATEDNKFAGIFEPSKLEKLRDSDLRIIISFVGTKELNDIFRQYDIDSIILDEVALDHLSSVVNNLHDSMFEKGVFNDEQIKKLPFRISHIQYILGNIIYVINKCENDFSKDFIDKIYKIVHAHSELLQEAVIINSLHGIIKKYPPINSMAESLIKDCLKRDHYDLFSLISTLSSKLATSNYKFGKCIDFEHLVRGDGEIGLAMYKILPDEIQGRFLDYMFIHCKSLFYYLQTMYKAQTFPSNTEILIKLFDEYKQDENHLDTIYCLTILRKNMSFSNLFNLFDEFGKEHAVYQFLLAPLEFDINTIEPSWLRRCTDDEIRELLKNNTLRQKTKEYIQTNPIGRLLYKRIFALL